MSLIAQEPLAVRLCNAGNIAYSKGNHWQGQIGHKQGFVIFDSKENSLRALNIVLKKNIKKTKNVHSFVNKYTNRTGTKYLDFYEEEIKTFIGRKNLVESDSEILLPLIIYLEGGRKNFNYFIKDYSVTRGNGLLFRVIQIKIEKKRLHKARVSKVECYTLRNVLIGNEKPNYIQFTATSEDGKWMDNSSSR